MDKAFKFNLQWATARGHQASLTIQADSVDELVKLSGDAMTRMIKVAPAQQDHAAPEPPAPQEDLPAGPLPEENPHYCYDHSTAFDRHEGDDGAVWYSHKDNGGWCREPKKKAQRYPAKK